MPIFRGGPLTGGFRKSSFTPANLSGLAAWYSADSLTTSAAPDHIGGLVSWFRPDALVNTAVTDPTAISGLVSWFRADKGITIGTGVASWTDSAPGADSTHTLTQATGSKQPTFNATDAAYNNQPTLSFASASAQALQSSAWSSILPQPNTIVVIGNTDATANQQGFIDGIDGTNRQYLYNFSNASEISIFAGGNLTETDIANGNPMFIAAAINGASTDLYVNGNYRNVTGSAGSQSLGGLTVGSFYNTSSGATLNGKIAEVIVFNRALSQAEVQSLAMYAAKRYGLSISIGTMPDAATGADATHTLAQTIQSKQPTFNVSDAAYNNQPTLSFAKASSQYLRSTTWASSLAEPYTAIVIGNFGGGALDNEVMIDGLTQSEGLVYNTNTTVSIYAGVSLDYGAGSPISTPMFIGGIFNGASSSIYATSNLASVTGNAGSTARTGLTVGIDGDQTTAPFNGKIAEIAIFNRALSQAEIQSLEMYAAARYGLTLSIGTLNDKSGTGDSNKNVLQTTQSQQPTLNLADTAYGNQPSLSFSVAKGQFIKSGTWNTAINGDQTLFIVGNDDGSGSERVWIDNSSGAIECLFYYDGGTPTGHYSVNSNGAAMLWTHTAIATPQVVCAQYAATSAIYSNAKTAVATGGTINSKRIGVLIGDYVGATGGTFLGINGKIAEVVIYNRALNQGEIYQMLAYLGKKYNVTIGS